MTLWTVTEGVSLSKYNDGNASVNLTVRNDGSWGEQYQLTFPPYAPNGPSYLMVDGSGNISFQPTGVQPPGPDPDPELPEPPEPEIPTRPPYDGRPVLLQPLYFHPSKGGNTLWETMSINLSTKPLLAVDVVVCPFTYDTKQPTDTWSEQVDTLVKNAITELKAAGVRNVFGKIKCPKDFDQTAILLQAEKWKTVYGANGAYLTGVPMMDLTSTGTPGGDTFEKYQTVIDRMSIYFPFIQYGSDEGYTNCILEADQSINDGGAVNLKYRLLPVQGFMTFYDAEAKFISSDVKFPADTLNPISSYCAWLTQASWGSYDAIIEKLKSNRNVLKYICVTSNGDSTSDRNLAWGDVAQDVNAEWFNSLSDELGTWDPDGGVKPDPDGRNPMGIMAPLYQWPCESDGETYTAQWVDFLDCVKANPNIDVICILNVANGPGDDDNWTRSVYAKVIDDLRNKSKYPNIVGVYGYVSTRWGRESPWRPSGATADIPGRSHVEIVKDIDKWKSSYNVTNIFFDEAATEREYMDLYSGWCRKTKNAILNQGTRPHMDFYTIECDPMGGSQPVTIVAFEGTNKKWIDNFDYYQLPRKLLRSSACIYNTVQSQEIDLSRNISEAYARGWRWTAAVPGKGYDDLSYYVFVFGTVTIAFAMDNGWVPPGSVKKPKKHSEVPSTGRRTRSKPSTGTVSTVSTRGRTSKKKLSSVQ